jgi:phosphatidylglycerol lysyltransferase
MRFLLAFNQSVSPTIAVAGFAVAGLFNLVSITPQGIGVVETVMSATLTALGIPATTAALVTLAYRGVSLWLPFFIGFVLMRRVKAFGTTERTRSGVWSVRAVALLTTLMGIINVLSAMTPGLSARLAQLDPVVPVQAQEGAHFAAIVLGGFLLLIGVNLWRRKRTAWLLAIGTLLLSAILHIIKGLDYEEATISLAIVTWLVILRHQFHALPDLPSVRRAMGVLLGAILFTLVYGTVGLFLLDRQYSVNFGLGEALAQVIRMFTQFEDGLVPQTRFGEYFAWSIYAVAVVTFAYALLLVFRAVIVRQPATEDERAQATDIVKQYGHTALTSYALLTDKSYFFSTRGSVIQYVPNNAVAVVLGDPIGPDNDFEASIIEFLAFCQRNGWVATFYQVQEAGLPVYEAHGFKHVAIGEEGSVDLHSFSLQGGAKKSLRSGTNKLQKSGYTAQVHQPLHEQALLDTLHEISDEWLTEMHGTEKRFSIGWFDDAYMQQGPIMAIHDSEGTVIAFANIISEYQLNESSIDLMRHRADVPNGIMDYLFVSLFLWSKEQGYDSFNLGLSALSGVGDEPEDPRAERALHYIYDHIDQFYNFKGLHNFKEKFDPIWTMRYLAYPGAASLPSIGLAMMRADSGDDWLWAYIRDLREALKQRRQNKAAQLSVSSGESKKLNEL